jgi:ADP-ribosylglycohydrolase
MSETCLEQRIKGCLLGAAIGAELSLARIVHPERFDVHEPEDVLGLKLAPTGEYADPVGRTWYAKARPLVDLGVRAYLQAGGRVTPEAFGELFKNDPGIAQPFFAYDTLHSQQELLKEGMHPRLGGMLAAPTGLIAGAMPAVGIFHFADPERAYQDGVELASVAQDRLGADWAALSAAAVAAALAPGATAESVIEAVLTLAHRVNNDVFYSLNKPTRRGADQARADEKAFVRWWLMTGGRTSCDGVHDMGWIDYNPLRFVLPLLKTYAHTPEQMLALILVPVPDEMGWINKGHIVPPVLAAALAGALYGPEVFPAEWRTWAEPLAEPWYGLAGVALKRLEVERGIISVVDALAAPGQDGLTLLQDKIYGNILAGAIGNAMGSPVESLYYWEIDAKYPGGIQTILDPQRLESEDDNQMAMLLTETYLAREGQPVMARDFGATWQARLNRDHFFPLCMGRAYDLICAGWDPRITGHWSVVTGSTVMCMEPVGIYNIADPEYASIDATAISYMYQRGLDMATAANLAATVAEALRPGATVNSVCKAALDTAPAEPLKTFDNRPFYSYRNYLETCLEVADKYNDVLEARKELCERALLYHPIDPLELWGFSLAMFMIADGDVRQAAIGGTNIGRDSDTIAGRAAMLAGTLRGASGVPKEWMAMFKPEVLDKIRRNAVRFAALIAGPKADLLRARQAAAH